MKKRSRRVREEEDASEPFPLPVVMHHINSNKTSIFECLDRAVKIVIGVLAFTLVAVLVVFIAITAQKIISIGGGFSDAFSYAGTEFSNQFHHLKNEYCPEFICTVPLSKDSVKKNELTRIIQTVINNSTTLDTITNSKIKMNEVKLNLMGLKHIALSDKAKSIRDTIGKMQEPVAVMDRIRIDTKNLLKSFKKKSSDGAVMAWTEVKSDIEEQVVMFAQSCDNLKSHFKNVIEQVDELMDQVTLIHVDDTALCKLVGIGCSVQKRLDQTRDMLLREYTTMELLSSQLIELKINAIGDAGANMFILPPSSHFKNDEEIIKLLDVA